ncbi:hypothetical protein, partial [Halorubrum tibetense]
FRLNPNGYTLSGPLTWFAGNVPYDSASGVVHRTLHNQTGHIGPLPGDMARSAVGLINGDLGAVLGDRDAGLGRSWERLHLIGVSAGLLSERRYSNYNTVIGSHAMNTAMIPFEGIANWVLSQGRSYRYVVNVDEHKTLNFIDKNGAAREEKVPVKLRQAISYTSENDADIWITICQTHQDSRVAGLSTDVVIGYSADIMDEHKMKTSSWEAVYAQIAAIDQQVKDTQASGKWNLVK